MVQMQGYNNPAAYTNPAAAAAPAAQGYLQNQQHMAQR